MKVNYFVLFVSAVLMLFSACQENEILNNLMEDSIDLTEDQKMELVASGIASATGGVMNVFQTAASVADPSFYAPGKLDTTVTYQWVHTDLEIFFFAQDGTELPFYIPGAVDSLVCQAKFTGDTTYASGASNNGEWQISLNTFSTMYVKHFAPDTVRINGSGVDSSDHVYSGSSNTFDIDSYSTFGAHNVLVPLSGANHIPVSGTISGAVTGTVTSEELSKDISIPYSAEFTGNNEVTVTLTDSGKQFTVNLITGEITG